MADIKIGTKTYTGIEKFNIPLADGSGNETFGTCIFPHADIPVYVKNEVARVIEEVRKVQTSKTITFPIVTDAHQDFTNSNIVAGNTHAGMALKALSYALEFDFASHLGDSSWGSYTSTIEDGKAEIEEVNRYLSEAFEGLPKFFTVGNHDPHVYPIAQNGEMLSDEYLFSQFGIYNEGAVYGSTTKGYCYRDFESKKVRVICLNTSEFDSDSQASSGEISPTQQKWFADTLKEVGSKSNASQWGIIILSHHPLDWGDVAYASNILKAYVDGTSISVNGTSVNFSGSNNAKVIAQFHGHVHGLKVDYLHEVNTTSWSKKEQYSVKRIAIPNMCFGRNNEYGQNSGLDINGIEFGQTETYNKTAGTAQDTSFNVVVINPETSMIYAICYGAGYDRTITYQSNAYVVVTDLTNCTYSGVESILDGQSFNASISATAGHGMSSVVVKMGGVDITSSVYSNGVITIPSVTGDISITAIAHVVASYTNLVPQARVLNGTALYNGIGYKNETRISGASYSAGSGYVATGFIPWEKTQTIYIKGATLDSSLGYCRMTTIAISGSSEVASVQIIGNTSNSANKWDTYFTITELGNQHYKLVPKGAITATNIGFIISLYGTGENLIITVDEEIK